MLLCKHCQNTTTIFWLAVHWKKVGITPTCWHEPLQLFGKCYANREMADRKQNISAKLNIGEKIEMAIDFCRHNRELDSAIHFCVRGGVSSFVHYTWQGCWWGTRAVSPNRQTAVHPSPQTSAPRETPEEISDDCFLSYPEKTRTFCFSWTRCD